jgi:DNA processing protein
MPATERTQDSETRDLLLLARACMDMPRVALWQVSAVVQRVGSAQTVLEGEFEPETQWELAVRVAANELRPQLEQVRGRLEEDLGEWRERGLRLTTVLDDDYPLNLRFVYDRPPFLFYRGELRADDAYALAVVGTRNATDAGAKRARRMARLLTERGATVLSGLAKGIDTAAHAATLEAEGRTVAVLGHGFDHMYPKENGALADAIAERGAVVSQFFPSTPPTRNTFPLRNGVTSGMGQGTIVIEASKTSGARLQARLAVEHGKHAFLLKSLVEEHAWAREFATKEHVVIVDGVDEVLAFMRKPVELSDEWDERRSEILAATAEPPEYVQRRLSQVRDRNQQQLSL